MAQRVAELLGRSRRKGSLAGCCLLASSLMPWGCDPKGIWNTLGINKTILGGLGRNCRGTGWANKDKFSSQRSHRGAVASSVTFTLPCALASAGRGVSVSGQLHATPETSQRQCSERSWGSPAHRGWGILSEMWSPVFSAEARRHAW